MRSETFLYKSVSRILIFMMTAKTVVVLNHTLQYTELRFYIPLDTQYVMLFPANPLTNIEKTRRNNLKKYTTRM